MIYETTQDLYDALSAPFPVEMIEWRVGSTNKDKTKCLPLCYIDARAVMDRLDTVCGPDGWQCRYDLLPGMAVCNLGIRVGRKALMALMPSSDPYAQVSTSPAINITPNHEWLWKADGAGHSDIEGEKGALSDALKRAAVRWGVGRYLYDLKAAWVPLTDGRYIGDEERKKLDNLHEDFAQKAGWGMRAGIQAYKVLNQVVKRFVTDAPSAIEFKEQNGSMIAQMPVAMRRHLNDTLDRIGAPISEAAE